MAYNQEIKDYAKQLYLTISKNGQHKYTEEEIVQKISSKFPELPKFPDRRTINNWIKTKDKNSNKSWKDLWKAGVRHGIQNAAREHEKELEGEEEFEIHYKKNELTESGQKIEKLLKKYQDTPMRDYRNNKKKVIVGIINSHYQMTKGQKESVNYVIDKYSLNQLHSRLKNRTIILAICIYFQKKDGRHFNIHNSKYCASFGLNNDAYNIISSNLDKLCDF